MKKFKDCEVLSIIEEYTKNLQISIKQICVKYNISKSSLLDMVHGKTYKHINRPDLTKRKDIIHDFPDMSFEQVSVIEGSMLGDGSIKTPPQQNARFRKTQCIKNIEYLQWHMNLFALYSRSIRYGFSKGILHDNNGRIIGSSDVLHENAEFTTIHHPLFSLMAKRWYLCNELKEFVLNDKKQKKKIVPRDLVLNPISLAIWMCDDGFNKKKTRQIGFCTESFTFEENEFLQKQLYDIFNIKSYIYSDRGNPIIYCSASAYGDILEILTPHIKFKCLRYKIERK